ncbi:helix-turn-helix domain-containing protein [Pseudanabaena sp. PCC 6802]|uniref:helix-turn-helix domain-containing protein n=1 Tax=Pseudanabaena sp. PCC 6802 TaxID=118173 RepID=UPI000348766F|nr:helix-turn-helix transcriptional regulator [Pseudanabaena sp. PCC 6802]
MNAPVITTEGKRLLGKLLKESREGLGLSLDNLVLLIEKQTGRTLSKSTISGLERGNAKPEWDTLSILASARYIKKETGSPYATAELFEIACQSQEDRAANFRHAIGAA